MCKIFMRFFILNLTKQNKMNLHIVSKEKKPQQLWEKAWR